MTIAYLTNRAYGFPRGVARRIAPRRLVCIHVTANPNTPPATAMQERDYANREGSIGPSAHAYLDRDGTWVHAVSPRFAAWSNGLLRSPKTAVPGIVEVVELDRRTVPGTSTTYNPNEDYYREVELCGRYPDFPITADQEEELARQIAQDSLDTGIPISRATVHLHSDIDTEQRPNCPVPAAQAERFAARVVAAALEERDRLELEQLRDQVADLKDQLADAQGETTHMRELLTTTAKQRDEALAWGRQLQAFGGQILATDGPEWAR